MTTWTPQALHSVNGILSAMYPKEIDSRRVVEFVGMNAAMIAFDAQASLNWFNILQQAKLHDKVDEILNFAHQEYPGNQALLRALAGAPPPEVPAPDINGANWRGPGEAQLEKLMGAKSTLVDVSYLERGVERSRSVVRVVHSNGSSGSGFLTTDNLLVTNHHVLKTAEATGGAKVQFNYQKTADGTDAAIEEFELDPASYFKTSEEDDWTIVKVQGNPQEKWGVIELKNIAVREGDHVNIVQHPGGAQKQISISANTVAFVGDGRVQYLTDTLPGSSGSPVFDDTWNVVALHHSGGWLSEPNSSSKTTYLRNEGISIDLVMAGLP